MSRGRRSWRALRPSRVEHRVTRLFWRFTAHCFFPFCHDLRLLLVELVKVSGNSPRSLASLSLNGGPPRSLRAWTCGVVTCVDCGLVCARSVRVWGWGEEGVERTVRSMQALLQNVANQCTFVEQAPLEKASIDEVYMDVTAEVERQLQVIPASRPPSFHPSQ